MGFLSGKIITATPQMEDSRFHHAVILIIEHDDEHAIGIVLNKQLQNLTLIEIGGQLGIDTKNITENDDDIPPIYDGGPCELERGFIVHSNDWFDLTTCEIDKNLSYSISKDIIEAIIMHGGPSKSMIAMGYAGWAAGQLENEIAQNHWLVGDTDDILIFSDIAKDLKWNRAMSLMNIDPKRLSTLVGNA